MGSTKRCSRCGRELDASEFNGNASRPDGLQAECRECMGAVRRDRYATGRDLEARVSQCERNPTPKRAYLALRLAMNAGLVTKPDHCSGCGCPDTERVIQAHHADYSRPLDVIWLCPRCHARLDAMRREREAALAGA